MNKLNGGYIMIDATSSTLQADLKKAYETGRPVLYYDATGKAEFATIEKFGSSYLVKKLSDVLIKRVYELTTYDENDELQDKFRIISLQNDLSIAESYEDLIEYVNIINPQQAKVGGTNLNIAMGVIDADNGTINYFKFSDGAYGGVDLGDYENIQLEVIE